MAPDRGGLVAHGRAPSSGTAARATTGDGCSANPAICSDEGVEANRGVATGTRAAGDGRGCCAGNGAPTGQPTYEAESPGSVPRNAPDRPMIRGSAQERAKTTRERTEPLIKDCHVRATGELVATCEEEQHHGLGDQGNTGNDLVAEIDPTAQKLEGGIAEHQPDE